MIEEHSNWIGGERRPAAAGATFELQGSRGIARWPRSDERDVEAAIATARRAEPAWRALGESRRLAILRAAAHELASGGFVRESVAETLGLEPAELEPHLATALAGLESVLAGPSDSGFAGSGPLVLAPWWSDLFGGAIALFAELRAGRTVVLLADSRIPALADALAEALQHAGIEAGACACLHDDTQTALRSVLARDGAADLRASGPPARTREIARRVRGLERAAIDNERFGAGLADRPSQDGDLDLRTLRNATYRVRLGADPASEAGRVVERAFGRSATLSGQLPGSVGRVVCHQRLFSRFTEELLLALERDPDVRRPLPVVEAATTHHLRRALDLGHDEGATLIFEGAESRTSAGEAILSPVVFTNVEEHMRLAWLARPAPLLCLMRVESDAAGAKLAESLDASSVAEDLSDEGDARDAALDPSDLPDR